MDVDFVNVSAGVSRDAYFALAEEARHERKPVAGEIPGTVTPWEALQARQSSFEHYVGFASLFKEGYSDTLALQFFAAAAEAGARVTPMLVASKRTPETSAYQLTRLAKRTAVELLAGTDTGQSGTTVGETLHDELQELVSAGLTPAEALQSATIAPARFLGWDQAMGTIEVRKVADLVMLEANPLEDIRNTRKIAAVVVRGKVHRQSK